MSMRTCRLPGPEVAPRTRAAAGRSRRKGPFPTELRQQGGDGPTQCNRGHIHFPSVEQRRMNARASPSFRGTVQLEALIERMRPLADFLTKYKPECHVLTLSKRDVALLHKYPETAAALYDITTSPTTGVMYWRGFWELRPEPAATHPRRQLTP